MRLTRETVIEAVQQGEAVEQLLGPAFVGDRAGTRWASIDRRGERYCVWLHVVQDTGQGDLRSWPPLDPIAEGPDLIADEPDVWQAIRAADQRLSTHGGRWCLIGAANVDYVEYAAGRLPHPLADADAVAAVRRLASGEGSERMQGWWVDSLQRQLGCVHISDLIFWSRPENTPEEVVAHARACQPIALEG
jgi:hypothetical protein